MTYRVRRQSLTGKLILQHYMYAGGWADAQALPGEFEVVPVAEFRRLIARVDQADRRAAAQKKSRDCAQRERAVHRLTAFGPA